MNRTFSVLPQQTARASELVVSLGQQHLGEGGWAQYLSHGPSDLTDGMVAYVVTFHPENTTEEVPLDRVDAFFDDLSLQMAELSIEEDQ